MESAMSCRDCIRKNGCTLRESLDGIKTYSSCEHHERAGNPDSDMKSPDPICKPVPVPEEPVNPLTLQEEFDTHGISTPNTVKPSGVDGDVDKEIGVVLCKYGCLIGDCKKDTYECNREFKQTLDKLYLKKFVEKLEGKRASGWKWDNDKQDYIPTAGTTVLWSDILNLK